MGFPFGPRLFWSALVLLVACGPVARHTPHALKQNKIAMVLYTIGFEMSSSLKAKGIFLARCLCGGVLLYAGVSKALSSIPEFAAIIQAYRILPAAWALPLAHIIPWVELYSGLFLIVGYYTRYAAVMTVLLFTTFVCFLGSAIFRHIDLASCGCFGPQAHFSPKYMIGGDLLLLTLALCILFSTELGWKIDSWIEFALVRQLNNRNT